MNLNNMRVKRFNEFLNEAKKDTKGYIKLVFVGDIMQHQKQLKHEESEGFSYEGVFDDVKYIFDKADMVVGNLETTFSGDFGNKREDDVIHFSAHDKLAEALKNAGFTHIGIANNHILDHGISGMQRTKEILEKSDLSVLENKNLFDVGEYKIEIYNFTTHINGDVPESIEENLMNENLAANLDADINISYVHWGGEYTTQEIKEQTQLANSLSTRGYEFVIGSGPHEVHKTTLSENSLVAYSLGDFLSEHMDKRAKDEGSILSIEISESQIHGVTVYHTKSHSEDGDSKVIVKSREVLL